jgi:hypothetical protein
MREGRAAADARGVPAGVPFGLMKGRGPRAKGLLRMHA